MTLSLGAYAQDSLLLRDYQRVKQYDPWLTGNNAAALTRFQSNNIAEANLYLQHGKGGWVDYYQSPNTISAGAKIESFYRINKKAVAYGKMGYDNDTGRDMTGSAFINPTRLPFDIIEDSLTNEGRKHRDTYLLTGAIGIDLWRGLSIGARADYTAANYAKYKDLRHKNKLLDLSLSAGVYAPIGSFINVGANYRYHRYVESVTFSMYGKSEKVYKSFVNYGPYIGRVEQFGNGGFTDKMHEMPLANDDNGVEVQLDFNILPNLSFYNCFTYHHRTGYYGRKSPYTITYTNHHSDGYAYLGQLNFQVRDMHHSLSTRIETENLENYLETYRELQNDNGAFYYEYYDPVKSGNRLWVNTDIDYHGQFAIRGELPTWDIHTGVHLAHRKQTGYQYPYLRRQNLHRTELIVQIERNVFMHKGVLSLCAGGAYIKGSGRPFEDGILSMPSDLQTSPPTMEAFMYREFQYFTSPQYTVNGSVKYAFMFPKTKMKTHIKLGINHQKANGTQLYEQGKRHIQLELVVGGTL